MHDDLREFLEALLSNSVEFVVVGAHALAWHARPRFTEDLDIFLRRSEENREHLASALHSFGLPVTKEALVKLFGNEREMLVLGVEPNAIDLMNFLSGVSFDEAWQSRVHGKVLGVSVPILAIDQYRKTKAAAGRPKDLADLAILDEFLGT